MACFDVCSNQTHTVCLFLFHTIGNAEVYDLFWCFGSVDNLLLLFFPSRALVHLHIGKYYQPDLQFSCFLFREE